MRRTRTGLTTQAGFTLLEVMCAFSVLALVTTFMTEIWADGIEKAETAIDQREMREIADTVFGKILFEEQEHSDGQEDTLDNAYGRWAQLPPAKRDRYRDYRYVLEKKLTTVSGSGSEDGDAENMFANEDDDSSSSSLSTEDEEGEGAAGVELWRYTMRIFHKDSGDEPLITLQTYRKPSESALAEHSR